MLDPDTGPVYKCDLGGRKPSDNNMSAVSGTRKPVKGRESIRADGNGYCPSPLQDKQRLEPDTGPVYKCNLEGRKLSDNSLCAESGTRETVQGRQSIKADGHIRGTIPGNCQSRRTVRQF